MQNTQKLQLARSKPLRTIADMRFHRAILAFLVALPFGSAIASGACGCELLGGYLQIGGALCSDNLSEVKVAAAKLLKDAEFDNIDAIIAGARAISEAKDLTVARNAFRVLSEEVIPLAEGDSDYVLLT